MDWWNNKRLKWDNTCHYPIKGKLEYCSECILTDNCQCDLKEKNSKKRKSLPIVEVNE